ncbi:MULTISPECIES: SdpI family protein [unclassified Methanoregula]|uniref:SdpI family protein n=1 Tax=unclassified Methanoregula TaxID=2649730 RepID=UPI0025F75FBC|nr:MULTISPECIES: DUF1648 domain-containing protein [unclassified Methanoregula]
MKYHTADAGPDRKTVTHPIPHLHSPSKPTTRHEPHPASNHRRPLTSLVPLAAYPVLPDQIISHGNAAGEPDGSMGKLAGIGLVPLITVALVALLLFLPRIDPLRKNYDAFRDWYDGFIPAFVLFMPAIQCEIILWSLGYRISINLVMPVLVGLLFLYCGFFLEKVEPNWFAGIRTPWTLSSPSVWKKTTCQAGPYSRLPVS